LLVRLASSDAMKKVRWKQEGMTWDKLFIGRKCTSKCDREEGRSYMSQYEGVWDTSKYREVQVHVLVWQTEICGRRCWRLIVVVAEDHLYSFDSSSCRPYRKKYE